MSRMGNLQKWTGLDTRQFGIWMIVHVFIFFIMGMSMLYFLNSMGYTINTKNSPVHVVGLLTVIIIFMVILYIEKKLGWIKGSYDISTNDNVHIISPIKLRLALLIPTLIVGTIVYYILNNMSFSRNPQTDTAFIIAMVAAIITIVTTLFAYIQWLRHDN